MSEKNPTAKERLAALERQRDQMTDRLAKLDDRIADMAVKAEREVSDVQIRNGTAESIRAHLDRLGFTDVSLDLDNLGPLGGRSSRVTFTTEGRQVVVNVYCDDMTNKDDPPAPFALRPRPNTMRLFDHITDGYGG